MTINLGAAFTLTIFSTNKPKYTFPSHLLLNLAYLSMLSILPQTALWEVWVSERISNIDKWQILGVLVWGRWALAGLMVEWMVNMMLSFCGYIWHVKHARWFFCSSGIIPTDGRCHFAVHATFLSWSAWLSRPSIRMDTNENHGKQVTSSTAVNSWNKHGDTFIVEPDNCFVDRWKITFDLPCYVFTWARGLVLLIDEKLPLIYRVMFSHNWFGRSHHVMLILGQMVTWVTFRLCNGR